MRCSHLRVKGTFVMVRAMTRHCWKCGWEWTLAGQPGRSECCHGCNSDLRVCLNCLHYDTKVAYQCRERRAEPVDQKHVGNYCEYFDFIRRDYRKPDLGEARENTARANLRKLFGD